MIAVAALLLLGSAVSTAAVFPPRDAAETATKVLPSRSAASETTAKEVIPMTTPNEVTAGGLNMNGGTSPEFHPKAPEGGVVMSYAYDGQEDEVPREDLWEEMDVPVLRELSYTYTTCAAGQYGPTGGYSPCYSCPSGMYCTSGVTSGSYCASGKYAAAGERNRLPCLCSWFVWSSRVQTFS